MDNRIFSGPEGRLVDEPSVTERARSWKMKAAIVAGIGIPIGLAATATSAAADPFGAPENTGTGQTVTSADFGFTADGASLADYGHSYQDLTLPSSMSSQATPQFDPISHAGPFTNNVSFELVSAPTAEPHTNTVGLSSRSGFGMDTEIDDLSPADPQWDFYADSDSGNERDWHTIAASEYTTWDGFLRDLNNPAPVGTWLPLNGAAIPEGSDRTPVHRYDLDAIVGWATS